MGKLKYELINAAKAAQVLGVTDGRIRQLILEGRIRAARKLGSQWVINARILDDGKLHVAVSPAKSKEK